MVTGNEGFLNSAHEPYSQTLCVSCIPSKYEIDDWTVSVPIQIRSESSLRFPSSPEGTDPWKTDM